MKPTVLVISCVLLACQASGPAPGEPLPEAPLRAIADELVARTGAPGAVLVVQRGDQRWRGTSGTADLLGATPMPVEARFRAASLTKMFTGAMVMQLVESGQLSLDDRLSMFRPEFPNADQITIAQLLSHTAGVTTMWFDQPALQGQLAGDLSRAWAPGEVLTKMAEFPAAGGPGSVGMRYSNTGFVLLGDILEQTTGLRYADLLQRRLLQPLALDHTEYVFTTPPGSVPGYFEVAGAVLDTVHVSLPALVSFAGAAGAISSSADDLATFVDALVLGDELLGESSRAMMAMPAEPGSWYAHGLMRFCPCDDGPGGSAFTGVGHGGNLPGYWAVAVAYPGAAGAEDDVVVVAMINRDSVQGATFDRHVFDPTLAAVRSAVR